jgi:DNA-binding NtrC family response regulator
MKNLNFPGLPRVMVIDDEEGMRDGLRALLQAEGVAIETSSKIEDAVARAENKAFDIIFVNINLAGADGLNVIGTLRQSTPSTDIVILSGYGVVANAIEAMRKGASDVIEKPFTQDRILSVVRRSLDTRQLKSELTRARGRVQELTSTELVGLSPVIRKVQARIDHISHAPDTTVLVTGKAGTGKELAARCIHDRSDRRHGPFVTVNCAAWTESLLEVEMFGCESGVFTGVGSEGKEGLFAAASGGTIFLDEIAGMAMTLQTKILRVLESRTYHKVGGAQELTMDVRVIVSTKFDLRSEVEAGRFREDLFYRLNVMTLDVPVLMDRPEDIPLLAHFFLDQVGCHMGKALSGFTAEAMETLCEYSWPGNVREIRNVVERAAMACSNGIIDERLLPDFTGGSPDGSDAIARGNITLDMKDCSIRALEGQLVSQVLEDTSWNISKAAVILGINRTTLYNKIRLHSLGNRPTRAKAPTL